MFFSGWLSHKYKELFGDKSKVFCNQIVNIVGAQPFILLYYSIFIEPYGATGGSIDILEVIFLEVYLVMLMMLNISFFASVY